MEIVYWIIIKPFGLPMIPCSIETCTQHHYPSPTAKRITTIVQGTNFLALMIFTGWRTYLAVHRYLYLPIPDEKRNQIPEGPSHLPEDPPPPEDPSEFEY